MSYLGLLQSADHSAFCMVVEHILKSTPCPGEEKELLSWALPDSVRRGHSRPQWPSHVGCIAGHPGHLSATPPQGRSHFHGDTEVSWSCGSGSVFVLMVQGNSGQSCQGRGTQWHQSPWSPSPHPWFRERRGSTTQKAVAAQSSSFSLCFC